MISYILSSFRTFLIFILTVYFCSNFMGCIYIFCNGIYFISKISIVIITFNNLQKIKKNNKRKVKLRYLYMGNKVKEITI